MRHFHSNLLLALLSILLGGINAWLLTILLVGRSLPWQASRTWAIVFAVLLIMASAFWWRYWVKAGQTASTKTDWLRGTLWGTAPPATICILFIALFHLSDPLNELIQWPYWRMQVQVVALLSAILMESMSAASLIWIKNRELGIFGALQSAMSRRGWPIAWGCLASVGLIQGMASATPIGDDIGKYTEAGIALLRGSPYPIHQATTYLVETGMTADSPAMPVLPVLLSISFALVGPTALGLVLPLAMLAAVFPLVLFHACLQITPKKSRMGRSRPIACKYQGSEK